MGLDSIIEMQSVAEPLTFGQLKRSSDERLVEALQSNNADALAVLYDRYHRLVFSIALKITRDAGEAEDVVQIVFLEISRVATQFDPARGTAKVWLLQYAYHRSINRRQYLQLRNFYDTVDLGEADGQVVPRVLETSLSDSRQLLRQALREVNKPERRVLELACFEGWTMREIADRTGESLANVRNHYYRGLEKLRNFLGTDRVVNKNVPGGENQ